MPRYHSGMNDAPDFRKRILDRLEELGHNRLWLVNACGGSPQKAQLYAYLCTTPKPRSANGETVTRLADMRSEHIEKICGILGLDLTPVRTPAAKRAKSATPPTMPL